MKTNDCRLPGNAMQISELPSSLSHWKTDTKSANGSKKPKQFFILLMLMFAMSFGGGKVNGQTQSNANSLYVNDTCSFHPFDYHGDNVVWFRFVSDGYTHILTIRDHPETKIPATIFNNVYIYDKNMNQVTSFTETSVNWTETFTVSNPSDTFFIKMETNSPPSWYDFDACLTRECNNNIDLPGQSICEGDPLCFDVVNCNGGDYLSIAIGGTIVATQPTPIFGNMTVTYCFPSLGFTTGSITVEACLYESSTGIAGYCETFTVTILPPPAIQITEGNVTICLGEFCFHDLTQNAYEVDWDLYYYYPGVGLNDEDHYHNRPPNDLYCYTFVNTGDYVLTATATGQCGTEESTVNIHVVPAVAEFDWTNACVGQPVCFTELASCEEFWHWDFGDGSTSTDPNPCHTYAQSGSYDVTLVIDQAGTSITHTVTVYDPVQPVISGDEYACDATSHYEVTPSGVFSQIGWAVNAPSGWIATVPPEEFNYSWPNGTGGTVYVTTIDNHGCEAQGEFMVFDCCSGGDIVWYNEQQILSGTIDQRTITINGTQNILLAGTQLFLHGCTILMGPNAKVTVEDGAWVRLGKCTVQACSGLMWDGFYVENGGYLQMDGNYLIKDAKNAVVSVDGGECRIEANLFDKNFKHIDIRTYNSTHQAVIKKNKFFCSGTILPQYPPVVAYRTQDAIVVNGVSSIDIGARNAGNTIENCDVGIFAMNSFVRVVGNTFQNIEPGSVMIGQPNHPRGYGIFTASLDLTGTNPYGLSTMPAALSLQGGNSFTDVTYGIYSFNNGQINIRNNTLKYPDNPYAHGTAITLAEISHPTQYKLITTNTIENYNKGILAGSTEYVRISGNTIKDVKNISTSFFSTRGMGIRIEGGSNNVVQGNTVINTTNPDWNLEGISVSNSGSLVVSCNTIRKMGKSIRFQGVNDPVQIKKNAMYNGTAGIVLSDNGFINEQGTTGTPWDNEWYAFSSRHLYAMNNTFANQIHYHIWTGGGPKHPANFDNGTDGSSFPFIISFENSSLLMLCATPIMSASPSYSSWMDDVAANTNANLQAPLHRNWMGRNELFKTLKQDSLLAQNASLQSFMLQLETESPGQLKKVADTLLLDDYLSAMQINQNLAAYTKPDSLSKNVNYIYISAALTGADDWATAITPAGWDSLRYFASLCPFEYGENVYLSRIVLKLIGDTTEYFNECEFDEAETPGKNAVFGNNDDAFTTVYPNPAKSEISIETEMVLPATLTIYSTLGEELFSVQITEEQSTINFGNIHPQLVLYKIQNSNGETSRGTLTIIE